jgi:uncharacterized membrane protein YoaK (UPF0700 family)
MIIESAAFSALPFAYGAALSIETPERPSTVKVGLLGTIAGTFTCGAMVGAFSAEVLAYKALVGPATLLFVAATYAFHTGRGGTLEERVGPASRV